MATTLMPIDPAMTPQRTNRLIGISVNLLPEEITRARRARRTRTWVIVAIAVVIALLGAWFFVAYQDSSAAEAELAEASNAVAQQQAQQRGFADVTGTQAKTAVLKKQLTAAMKDDLDWAALFNLIRGQGTLSGLTIISVSGSLKGAAGASSGGTISATAIGSMVVTGSGPDKEAVAAYIDDLAKQKNVANPYLTSISTVTNDETNEQKVTFSLNLDIQPAALCGRFSATNCAGRGGN
jgi:cell division protein FtsI/penicillin-binding protein 2